MNSLLRLSAATAAALIVTEALQAQSLTITNPAFSATKLFDSTAGYTISGLGASGTGEIFYLESDASFPATLNARLFKRSPVDGYATPTLLHDFGGPVFGSFVVLNGGKVFFGENFTGGIFSINPDGTGLDPLGTIAGNYDLAFSGGSLFLSHNSGFSPQNQVSKFNLVPDGGTGLMLSSADSIIDTADYSGPVEFGPAGLLFYGGTAASFGGKPDLFRFTAAEIAAANDAGPTLTLDSPHLFLANGANAGLAFDGGDGLWHTKERSIDRIDTDNAESTPVGTTANSLGQVDFSDGTVYATVTDFGGKRSSIFAVVPEPCSALLLLIGLATSQSRRRR
jgi:hypothetical protein